jgi:BMFP domain-containing protein YqiC
MGSVMWAKPKGNQPTREEFDDLIRRIEELENKLAEQPKRGRPKKEEESHG